MDGPPSASFQRDGYVIVERLVEPGVRSLANRYALWKSVMEPSLEPGHFPVPGVHGVYGDVIMESLLDELRPAVERHTGLPLWPTYSYYRVYRAGASVRHHQDRDACEISVSLCLGSSAASREDAWPLWVRDASGEPVSVRLEPGNAVVYRGTEVEHWREPLAGGWQAQVFLHYVIRRGPRAGHFLDGRMGLAMPAVRRGAPLESAPPPEPTEPEQLRALGVYWDPRALTSEQADVLCDEIAGSVVQAARVSATGTSVLDPRYRRTLVADVDPEVRKRVQDLLERLRPSVEAQLGTRLGPAQPPVFMIYRPGDYFRPHADNAGDSRQPDHIRARRATVVLYLNDAAGEHPEFEGGALYLYRLAKRAGWDDFCHVVRPAAGALVAFPAHVEHEVAPITRGCRFAIATWFTHPLG